jgi:FAD/FMN-containing dehydrogenase
MLENPITDISIAMEVNYFQLNRAQYFIPVAVKIPGSELALARRGGAQRTLIDFIGEVKDEYGSSYYILETLKHAFDPNGIMNKGTIFPV